MVHFWKLSFCLLSFCLPFKIPLIIIIVLFIYCMVRGVHVIAHVYGGQRTTLRSLCSPFAMWIRRMEMGIRLRLSDLMAVTFIPPVISPVLF